MSNGPKCFLVLDTGNRYTPSMTLRFIKTSPFKYLKRVFNPRCVFRVTSLCAQRVVKSAQHFVQYCVEVPVLQT